MYSASKRFVLVFNLALVAIHLLFIRNVMSMNMTNAYLHHKCFVSQGRYKAGSTYEENLKSIIDPISSSGQFSWGFEMRSIEISNVFVSFFLQCRADSLGPKCRSCYLTALSELHKRCPRYKSGTIWYDQCLFGISGIDTRGKVDYKDNFCMSNVKNVSGNQDSFDKNRKNLIDNLTSLAISKQNTSEPDSLYAAGERRIGNTKKLYGMVQCKKDITPKDCKECVVHNVKHFQNCLNGKRGARVMGRSCIFRYELYPFIYSKPGPKYI